MFAFKASVILKEYKLFQPDLLKNMQKILNAGGAISREAYEHLSDISIDYAIMEKTARGAVLPSRFRWSDIGSWKSLYDFLPKDKQNNVIDGDVLTQQTRNCFIMGHRRLIATSNVHDLVIVDTPDAVFVSDIDNSRDVKQIVARLKDAGRREHHHHPEVHYPWGRLTLLAEEPTFTVALRAIYPGQGCLLPPEASAQRSLTVIEGSGRLMTAGAEQSLARGSAVVLPGGAEAQIVNPGQNRMQCIETILNGD